MGPLGHRRLNPWESTASFLIDWSSFRPGSSRKAGFPDASGVSRSGFRRSSGRNTRVFADPWNRGQAFRISCRRTGFCETADGQAGFRCDGTCAAISRIIRRARRSSTTCNQLPPKRLEKKFELIFDGGTIEHVFNVPNALETVFRMLKTRRWRFISANG